MAIGAYRQTEADISTELISQAGIQLVKEAPRDWEVQVSSFFVIVEKYIL